MMKEEIISFQVDVVIVMILYKSGVHGSLWRAKMDRGSLVCQQMSTKVNEMFKSYGLLR